jgi:pimeloyl-ACP methyl ester carboxylesterase
MHYACGRKRLCLLVLDEISNNLRTTMDNLKKLLKIVAMAAVFVVVAVIVMVVWAWKNPLALYEMTTRRALVNSGLERMSMLLPGGELVWFEGGSGRDLIILHGAGEQAGGWAAVVPAFTEDYRVVLLDLPGHGESAPAEGPLKMTTIVEGVADFLESRRGREPAVLVGHSLGCLVAARVTERLPERVRRVILVNGGPLRWSTDDLMMPPKDREEAREMMDATRDPSSPRIPDFVLDDFVQHAAGGPIGRMAEESADMESHLMDGRLHEFVTPVDIVWGESDMLIPVDYARRMAQELPAARLTLVPGCGHHPANECPASLADKLEEVLVAEPVGGGS